MNNWLYAVMPISARWFYICCHIWEGKRRHSPPLVMRLCNSGWLPCGRGGDADRV